MALRMPDATWASGAIVGGAYRIEGLIGQGGFGSVFRAKRLSDGMPVAMKLLTRAGMLRPDAIARFQREAALAMRLTHASTIRVIDSGDVGNGMPFIAFELLEGRSLDSVLGAGPLDEDLALGIADALLGSLEEAHRAGIIHRDVKPPNVFLCNRPQGLVKLLDFGVAKSTLASDVGLTGDGVMVGTAAYMAPEQIETRDVSPGTDLYAVALVLAEMLTGRAVYRGPPIVICVDKARGLPVPFDETLRAGPYIDILERATRGNPAVRYSSAAEMRRDLLDCRASRPTMVSQPLPVPSRESAASRSIGGTAILTSPFVAADPRPPSARSATAFAPHLQGPDPYGPTQGIATPRHGVPEVSTLARTQMDPPAPVPGRLAKTVDADSSILVPKKRKRSAVVVTVVALLVLLALVASVVAWLLSRR
ncbi:MAG: serine/threonine protein kinase [Polyangiaceae bacterium]|nr:serine/threonine protein kinase [Polyangiaceae bacterium]